MNANLANALAALAVAKLDPTDVAAEGGSYDDLARACAAQSRRFEVMRPEAQLACLREAVAHIDQIEDADLGHVSSCLGEGFRSRAEMVAALVLAFVSADGANDVDEIFEESSDLDLLREMIEEEWIFDLKRGVTATEALDALTELRTGVSP